MYCPLVALVLGSVSLSLLGCATRFQVEHFRWVPPAPKAAVTSEELVSSLPAPPRIEIEPELYIGTPDFPRAPEERPRRRLPRIPPKPGESGEEADEATAPATPAPQLATLLSQQERHQIEIRFQQCFDRTAAAMGAVRPGALSAEQRAVVGRVASLSKQAAALKSQDPLTAYSLIERADLLMRDLVSRLK